MTQEPNNPSAGTDPVVPHTAALRRELQVEIMLKPASDEEWNAQLALIRATPAEYSSSTRTWRFWLNERTCVPEVLNPLFRAARQYGAVVSIHLAGASEQSPAPIEAAGSG